VDLRSVRRRCEVILREVETPEPFGVDAFARAVSRRRGRRLRLTTSARRSSRALGRRSGLRPRIGNCC
jgi:hypothetical protein